MLVYLNIGFAGMFFLVAAMGCSAPSQPGYRSLGLVDVSGTVTLDGQPVKNAAVCFYDPDGLQFSYGLTDGDGHYEMMFNSKQSGVLPGPKTVKISTADIPLGASYLSVAIDHGDDTESDLEDDDASHSDDGEIIPSRYNRNTILTVQVQSSRSDQNFELSTP